MDADLVLERQPHFHNQVLSVYSLRTSCESVVCPMSTERCLFDTISIDLLLLFFFFSFSVLVRSRTLETLNISGCGLGPEAGISLAEVLSSGYVQLETLSLDVSNNDFGPTGNGTTKV